MKISGDTSIYNFGERNDIYSLEFSLSPSNPYKRFEIETKKDSNIQLGLYFEDGLITDHNSKLLAAYNSDKFNIKLNINPNADIYDFYLNSSPLASNLSLNNYDADTLRIDVSDFVLNYSFDGYFGANNVTAVSSIDYVSGSGIGYITNNNPGDLYISTMEAPTGSGVYINSFDNTAIPSGGSGQFILDFYTEPISGDIYSINFGTNYGNYNKNISINIEEPDISYFNFILSGPDQIFAQNGSGQGIYLIQIDTNIDPTGFSLSLDYESGNEDVYEYLLGTGIGNGTFSGFLDRSGYLYCHNAVGNISATNSYTTETVSHTGFSMSRLFYAVGSNNFEYLINGTGTFSEAFIYEETDSGSLTGTPFTGVSGGEFYLSVAPVIEQTGFYYNFFNAYITGLITATTSSEAQKGIAYINQLVQGTPLYIDISGEYQENTGNYLAQAVLQKRVGITGNFEESTTGLIQGYIKIQEGISNFANQWNILTGDFFTGNLSDFKALGYGSSTQYINPSETTNISSGYTSIYAIVDYTNLFRGGHSDVAKLSVSCNGETQEILITGYNNSISFE